MRLRLPWRRPAELQQRALDTPVVLRGRVWVGDGAELTEGVVVVDKDGMVRACGEAGAVDVPPDATTIDAAWVGPGLVDAHVHLAFGDPAEMLAGGVVAVRDLGAPPADAVRWRRLAAPKVEVAGPLLTAPGGYPSRTWGSGGFAAFVDEPDQAERLVTGLAPQVDVVKLALEPAGGRVPSLEVAAGVVAAAHAAGRDVTAHALTVAMVERALDAGVDELAHLPVEPLPDELLQRLVSEHVNVVTTMETLMRDASRAVVDNAAAIASAGGTLLYGTDLGNAGTKPGADPAELKLLADEVGLGADGALRAATEPIVVGEPAALVALADDPRNDWRAYRHPVAVLVGLTLLTDGPPDGLT